MVAETPDIKVITGVRRSGKSKLLEMFKEYIKSNISNYNIIDINSKDSNYYCIDNSNLQELGLEIQTDSYYIVDYEQNDVIYVDGIKDSSGNMVYKLSDME